MDNVKFGFSDLEPLRKKLQFYINYLRYGTIILFVVFYTISFMTERVDRRAGKFLFFLCIVFFIVMEYIIATKYNQVKDKYVLVYKEVLVVPSLASKFDHYTYSPDGTVTTNDILAIGIWNTTHGSLESRTEDFLKGTYKGIYYEQVGASVWLRLTKIDTVSAFDGTISKFRFRKAISGKLVIARSINTNIFSVDGLSAIKTENEEFNRQLTIFSSQGHEAFYILTPHFMECILKLYNGYPRMMIIVFDHDTMTILRSGAKMCEFSEAKKVDFFEAKEKIIGEMKNMLDIVDTLNIGNPEK